MSVVAISLQVSPLRVMIEGAVKDTTGVLVTADFDAALAGALARYSKDRPRLVVADISGSGVQDYAVPAGWVDGLSTVESIEYPAGQIPEALLDSDDWKLYRSPSGIKIRLIESTPRTGETIRVLFSAGHDSSTIPDLDSAAVANLAASYCCRRLAQSYGQTSDASIQADSVNYRSKGDEFARRAKELEGLYRIHVGVKEGDTAPAASVTVEAPERERRRMTHR